MNRILIATAATLAWIASIVMLPFITHYAKHLIITANAVALGGDTPTWLIEFASFVGEGCVSIFLLFSVFGLAPLWLNAAEQRERGAR